MEESFVTGSFGFIIRGIDLSPDEITKKLNLKSSKVKKKGEIITKDIKMKDTYWNYQLKFKGYDELNQAVEKFLSSLLPYKSFIRAISDVYDAYISFSLQSNLGQLGFVLQPKTLRGIS
ncbi:DUF4279 domain-containing protein [Bacillus salipaludis]|uniref:DUF4279 domain-containing protein n=1 Tax=Bacillus salipaludis TaxID=2547811 RepID=UPI003D1CC064